MCRGERALGNAHEKQFVHGTGFLIMAGRQFGEHGGAAVSTVTFDSQLGRGLTQCVCVCSLVSIHQVLDELVIRLLSHDPAAGGQSRAV